MPQTHECSCVTGNDKRLPIYVLFWHICIYVFLYVNICVDMPVGLHACACAGCQKKHCVLLSSTLPLLFLKDTFPELGACVFSAGLKASNPQ